MRCHRAATNAESLDTTTELAAKLGVEPKDVRIMPGKVSVNEKVIKEPYVAEDPDMEYPVLSGSTATPKQWVKGNPHGGYCVKIPKGRLLVMGDNRNRSFDSRFWGLLDRRDVMGKAMFSFWPPGRIGIMR
jgi:signal peptidase I